MLFHYSFGSNLREFLILEYASGLSSHHRWVTWISFYNNTLAIARMGDVAVLFVMNGLSFLLSDSHLLVE